jgi:hypothetical protein
MRRLLFPLLMVAWTVLGTAPAAAGNTDDQAKAEQIAVHLRDSGRMRDYSVGVKYSGGTVWLAGRVASQQQMNSALEVVSEADGVQKIVNNLTVTPSAPSAGQSSIKRAAAATSYSQPHLESEWDGQAVETSPISRAPVAQSGAAPVKSDSKVTPAGYHRLAARKAARHACPPTMYAPIGGTANPPAYDQPYLPSYAWPSYAAYPNYAALTYPRQYSPTAWPYIGPFYPYPQVPLGWRKVALEWDDGWWFLDFYDRSHH